MGAFGVGALGVGGLEVDGREVDGREVDGREVGAAVTRVIAGAARGRRLAVPGGRLTRPTSDRAREGLFSTLAALHGPLDGACLLDLYAGSGAVGLEALSRGARRVLFVEADARAARVIRGNIASIGLAGAELVTDRVERLLSRGPAGPDRYDLAVADPPYAVSEAEISGVLAALAAGGWLAGRIHAGPLPSLR